jgi:chromosome segregation ATPase
LMPTATKPPDQAELQDRLAELEQQRQKAKDAITEAEERMKVAAARQQEIAVAVVAEDEEAVKEAEWIAESMSRLTRRRDAARSAVQQIDEQIEQARADIKEAERRKHQEAYNRLAEDRFCLEEKAEAQMRALLSTLGQLKQIDGRQRYEGMQAGRSNVQSESPLDRTIGNWLSARFGGVSNYLDGVSPMPGTEGKALHALDPLSRRPQPEEE